jgi:acetyltransferase-like isoleucine patch superfamily enzyme
LHYGKEYFSLEPKNYYLALEESFMRMKKINEFFYALLYKIGNNSTRVKIARKMGVKIGNNCLLFNSGFGTEPYLISIGNHCGIAAGVDFITHDGGTFVFRENRKFLGSKFGPIKIHDNSLIGINSIILPNVEIGPNSVVGAGSVVTKNVLANSVYAGNPAKYICSIEEYLDKCLHKNPGDMGIDDSKSEGHEEIIIKMFEKKIDEK